MKMYILGEQESGPTGFTHKFVVPYTDLTGTAATSLAVPLYAYTAGTYFAAAAYKLVTAFDGGATTNMAPDVGHNGATTDDPDSLIDNYETHVDATEVLYGDGNGAVFATLRTGYCALDAGNIEATFTATGANLTALTQGEVHIYLQIIDLTKI